MNHIQFALGFLIVLFVYIVITKIFIEVAAYIGGQLRFADFFIKLLRKIKKVLFK